MKLFFSLAGLCVFALAAIPAVAQHGGGSGHGGGGSHASGGGSHVSSGGGSRSYGGASESHAYSGASYYAGSSGRAGGFSGARSSSGSYTYPGAGIRETGNGSRVTSSEFTNHGGIRFSDFGVEESPRFSASMLPQRPAAASRSSFQIVASAENSERARRDGAGRALFNRRDHDFFRFRHSGFFLFGTPFCDPFGWAAYDQSFVDQNAFGCFGQGDFGLAYGPTAEWLGENLSVTPDMDADQASGDDADDDDSALASPDATSMPGMPGAPDSPDAAPQVTLLQLKDGSMYGLTAYWVEGGELHYVTNYGAPNAIALDRIDLAKTVQLNASNGQAFVLQEKPVVNQTAR